MKTKTKKMSNYPEPTVTFFLPITWDKEEGFKFVSDRFWRWFRWDVLKGEKDEYTDARYLISAL